MSEGARSELRATVAGLGAVLLWSSLAALTALVAPLPPLQLLTLSFSVAALFGLGYLALRARLNQLLKHTAGSLALSCGALLGYHALYFYALQRAPVVEANLINYLWPLLIVVWLGLTPGQRITRRQWLGTLCGLLAAVLLISRGRAVQLDLQAWPGYLAAFAAALLWSGYSVLNRRFVALSSESIVLPIALTALCAGLLHLLFESSQAPSAGQWGLILLMGLGPVGLAFALWDLGTKHGRLSLLGSLSYATPLLSTGLLLALGLAEPHPSQALALALLILGAGLSVQGVRRGPA